MTIWSSPRSRTTPSRSSSTSAGRQVEPGVGAHRGAQLAHHRGRAHAAAHHVADDERGAPGAELDDVVPVAADLRALDARRGSRWRPRGARGRRPACGQQAALQLVGDRVLARGGLRGRRRRRGSACSASRCSVMSCSAAAQHDRRAVVVALAARRARGRMRSAPSGGTTPALDVERRAALDRVRRSRPRRARGRRGGRRSSAPSRPPARELLARRCASRRRNSSEPRTALGREVDLPAADPGEPLRPGRAGPGCARAASRVRRARSSSRLARTRASSSRAVNGLTR